MLFVCAQGLAPGAQTAPSGLRDPAWSPDGRTLAVVVVDRIWTMAPDGGQARELAGVPGAAREPAWSPDGRYLALAADLGDGFDLLLFDTSTGTADRVVALPGDERWPAWTADGRLVFSHRAAGDVQWDLFVVDPLAEPSRRLALRLTRSPDDEIQPRVSADGRVAFTSNRNNDDGDFDVWVQPLPDADALFSGARPTAMRITRRSGYDGYPEWSPDGARLAYFSYRDGAGTTWVADIGLRAGRDVQAALSAWPSALVSRHGGSLAWSPDGTRLAIGEVPAPDLGYNGSPRRDAADPPPLFADGAYRLWLTSAAHAVDEHARGLPAPMPIPPAAYARAFSGVWSTLQRLYYQRDDRRLAWERVGADLAARAAAAETEAALEDVVDEMVARQPLATAPVTASRAMVVSAHPLASDAGRAVLERGGNVVDAAVAVSFVLGVVEPDASGIGGDGQAVLYLSGMPGPSVIDFKDETPAAATLDNPRIFKGARLAGDGPASVNVPGVVAGMDYLYQRYGSGRIAWADLIAPAVDHAEHGFVLDDTLPSTIAQGRRYFEKHLAAARIYLPGGRVPRAGDRFVNHDYAETLRAIAEGGADTFYRGSLARRIAADMQTNDGLITYEDLAQYRAVERKPVSGRYRDHLLFTGGPPVGAGVALLEAFQVMEHYTPRPQATAARDADYLHYLIEAWKQRDRIARIADPAVWAVDYAEHLDMAHARRRFERIDPARAGDFPEDSDEAVGTERIGSGTSGFVVADTEGNVIAVTQTLSTWGGSFYVSRGLGFLYNNHLRANRTGGAYGYLKPRMRSNTANVPMLVFAQHDGRLMPRLAVAAAGNAWIPAATYSVITAVLDGGLSMQQAVEAPRFLVGRDPAGPGGRRVRVDIEDRFPRNVLLDLAARGHRFRKIGRKGELREGFASAVAFDPDTRTLAGGADPRRSHAAAAVDGSLTTSQ